MHISEVLNSFFAYLFFMSVVITVNINPFEYSVSEDTTSVIVFLKASLPAPNEYTVTVATQDGTAFGESFVL